MYPMVVEKVINFLNKAREKYPCEVDCGGEITYANGNDGTNFDWNVNNRLCEFGWGVPDGSVWAFKCLVNDNGSAEIYCYPNGESDPVEIIKDDTLLTTEQVNVLYELMREYADDKGLFDVTLNKIDFEM